MSAIELSRWGQPAWRAMFEITTGELQDERDHGFAIPHTGAYCRGERDVGALYWDSGVLWWQIGARRSTLDDVRMLDLTRDARDTWTMIVEGTMGRCEWIYRCSGPESAIRDDPTYHLDEYEVENLGLLVRALFLDRNRRTRWLRPPPGL